MQVFFSLILTLVLAACSKPESKPNALAQEPSFGAGITDGRPAGPLFAQSVVGVYDPVRQQLCSGTLIAKNLVLTAAHCVAEATAELTVYGGVNLKDQTAMSTPVLDVRIHPFYAPNSLTERFDLAVLKIKSQELPAAYAPAQLPKENISVVSKDFLYLVGYGTTSEHKDDDAILRMTFRKAVKISQKTGTEFQLHTEKGRGTCVGDSGGPVFLQKKNEFTLVGVTSFSYRKNPTTKTDYKDACRSITVFTNVMANLKWIREASQDLQAPAN